MIKRIIFAMVLLVLFAQVPVFAQNIAVIVNKDSSLFSNKLVADISDIKDIYLGKTRFTGGSLIKAVNQGNKDIVIQFIKKVCGMELAEYQYHWVKMELESGISAPRVLDHGFDIIGYVEEEKNSIGYVWEDQAKNAEGVRVVLVIQE